MEKNKVSMRLFCVERGQLLFLHETSSGSLGDPEIRVDATGVNDGPRHLEWCLSFLVSSCPELEKLALAGGLILQELGSVSECLDYDTLAYQGEALGLQRVSTVTADGRQFEATRDITYY